MFFFFKRRGPRRRLSTWPSLKLGRLLASTACPSGTNPPLGLGDDEAATVGVRPEHIELSSEGGQLSGTVSHIERLGGDTNIYLDCGEAGLISARQFGQHDYEVDSKMSVGFDPSHSFRFDQNDNTIG